MLNPFYENLEAIRKLLICDFICENCDHHWRGKWYYVVTCPKCKEHSRILYKNVGRSCWEYV